MAFNPLHMFRKRQKTLLAILTIGTMFLFVLGSGTKGDLFSGGFFGGRKAGENYLRKSDGNDFMLNGKRVSASDLGSIRQERLLAARFLTQAYASALSKIGAEMKIIEDAQKKSLLDPTKKEGRFDLESFKRQQELRTQQAKIEAKGKYYSDYLQLHGPQREMFLEFLLKLRGPEREQMISFLPQLENESDASLVNEFLDYIVWRDEAKRLGMTYLSDADIDRILKETTFDHADLSEAVQFARASARENRETASVADVYNAVRNEIGVRQAQAALIGSNDAPSLYTRLEEFRKNRTSNFVAVMALPVKDFVAQVTETPTEEKLQKLFDTYKDQEYSPSSPRPGFKEPRRISLEWVSGRADSPFYRDQARNLLLSVVASSATDPWPTVDLAVSLLKDYRQQTTDIYTSRYALPPVTDANYGLAYATYFSKPESAAGLIGQLAQGELLSGVVNYQSCQAARGAKDEAAAVQREGNKRALIECTLLASMIQDAVAKQHSGDPLPLAGAIAWAGLAQEKQYLPLDVVNKQLLVEMEQKSAQKLLVQNFTKLQKELETKRFKPKEAREWLTKTLPEFGVIEHVIESKPLGQYEINADPQIQPFKEAYLRQGGVRETRAEQFAQMFFQNDGGAKTGPYVAKEWPYGVLNADSGQQAFLYWKTEEDKPPVVLKALEQTRAKVEEAWRFQKARELAEKQAEKLKGEAQATGGDTQKLKDLAAKYSLNYTELGGVARLVPQNVAMPTAGKSYKRYEFPPDALPHSDGQTQDQVLDKLVGLQKVGDAVVYWDQPKDQFYVATVYIRLDQSVDEFYRVYRDSTKTEMFQDRLFGALDQQRRNEFRQKLIRQLRSRVAAVDDKGQYDLDDRDRDEFQKRMHSARE